MGSWGATTGDQVLMSQGFGACTGLLMLSRNSQGVAEATLFHIAPGEFSESIKTRLKAINAAPGKKIALFMTNAMHSDPDAKQVIGMFSRLVKNVEVKPVMKCTPHGIAIAYDFNEDLLQVRNEAKRDIETTKPLFGAKAIQSITARSGGRNL